MSGLHRGEGLSVPHVIRYETLNNETSRVEPPCEFDLPAAIVQPAVPHPRSVTHRRKFRDTKVRCNIGKISRYTG